MTMLAEVQLSEKSRLFMQSMQKQVRDSHGSTQEILQQMALVAAALLALYGLLYLLGIVQLRRSNPVERLPRRLFSRLMVELELSWSERMLLRLVARADGREHPVALLLSPNLLETATRTWAERVHVVQFRKSAWRRLSDLSSRLHGRGFPSDS